ncbi:hypothetical protein [Streptomyces sp. CAU 1734]|uniref:hypothetical protein n=1 Tax=Streptomyces sp. CAU 1734 TaxID=3140360 RepID=UPI0032614FEA
MIRNRCAALVLACACVTTAVAPSAQAAAPLPWQLVGTGITGGVSGLAVVPGTSAGPGTADVVVARDNKKDHEERLVSVRLRDGLEPVVSPLRWVGEPPPKDLEALDGVPGLPDHYIALGSRGIAYHVVVADGAATVVGDPVTLPDRRDGDDYESFALAQPVAGRTVAVWASRGKSEEAAVVRAAAVTVGDRGLAIDPPSDRAEFAVPFPDEDEVRHISDLKILRDGTLLASSASDPNQDDGPFASAVYNAGSLALDGTGRPVLRLRAAYCLLPLRLFTKDDNRKVEAVAVLPDGRALWGTDDENHGGSLAFDRVRTGPTGPCPQPRNG